MSVPKLPPLPELTPETVAAMPANDRRALFRRLTVYAQQIAAAQMVVADLLDVHSEEALWDAKQTGTVLNLHPDTVRDHGAEWGIESDIPTDGIHRYIPEAVRALRERRKDAARVRVERRSRATGR